MPNFPKVGETVRVHVISTYSATGSWWKSPNIMGVTVTLPDYGNREGMIPLSEISHSNSNAKSVARVMRQKEHCAIVLRVDEDKGYIDL